MSSAQQRWTLHILPKGFTKVRSNGAWSNSRREEYQQLCERLQPVARAAEPEVAVPRPTELELAEDNEVKCPRCGSAMELVSETRRPSWRELFYGPDHPHWVEWRSSG